MDNIRKLLAFGKVSFRQPISFTEQPTNTSQITGLKPCWDKKCVQNVYESQYNAYTDSYILQNLPYLGLAIDTKLNLLIGGGLKLTDENKDTSFQDWLYKGDTLTNISHIREAIRDYVKGSCGYIYKLQNGNLLRLKPENVHAITINNPTVHGLTYAVGYYVDNSKKGFKLEEVKDEVLKTPEQIIDFEGGYYLPSKYVIVFVDVDSQSPLYIDRLRIQLILDAYLQNIDDINSEQTEKLALWLKDNIEPEVLGLSREQVTNDPSLYQNKLKEAINTIKTNMQLAMLNQDDRSKPLVLNKQIIEQMDKVQKTNNAYDYLEYLRTESIKLSASLMGLNPVLLGERETGLSSSVKDVIEYTLESIIAPIQDHLSSLLTKALTEQFKIGVKDEILLLSAYKTSTKEILETEKQAIENTRGLIHSGVPTEQAYEYLNRNVQLELEQTESLRLIESNLQNLNDSIQ